MSENKQEMLSEENAKYLQFLEASPGWRADVIQLVREDFAYGLSKEQVQRYVKKDGDIHRMKLYSQCLRNRYAEEVIGVLTDEKQDIYRCLLAVEFYERGIALDDIRSVMRETQNAKEMQEMFLEVQKQKENLAAKAQEVPSYARQLIGEIQDITGKLQLQMGFYEELQRVVRVLEDSKKAEAVNEELLKEIREREAQIKALQDELNKGHEKIAKQREEMETLLAEVERYKNMIAILEAKLSKAGSEALQQKNACKKEDSAPVHFSTPVVDSGKVVCSTLLEPAKAVGSMPRRRLEKVRSILAPGTDIVKRVIEEGLDEQQVTLIKVAMEKKLTDTQLNQLINRTLSPQKMSEIIELAVLINANR